MAIECVGFNGNEKLRAVIVEDDKGALDMMAAMVSREGLSVVKINRSLDAIDYCTNNEVDIMITDVRMPEMNGIELVRELRDKGIFIETIVATAFDDPEVMRECGSFHLAGFLIKPFTLADMRNALARPMLQLSLARENRLLREKLMIANRLASIGRNSAEMSHEMRSILSQVRGASQTIKQVWDDCQPLLAVHDAEPIGMTTVATGRRVVNESLEDVDKSTEYMIDIFNAYQNLLSPGRGEQKVEMKDIVREAVDFTEYGRVRETEFEITIDEKAGAYRIERRKMLQVLINLLSNAYRACEQSKKPKIWVIVREQDDKLDAPPRDDIRYLLAIVRDNGTGVSEELKDKIFDDFYSASEEGLGLGLSVSRDIIRSFGGDIGVCLNWNAGACFKVFIPLDHVTGA
ncbi:MAG: response regulator [Planctomycetes bacterium]|nr:response regulator [Planctomycetota bacterium]